MEISREYQPIFKTTITGLAKKKLQGRGDLSREEINQIIAICALRENNSFTDYKMRVFDDAIRFEKSQDGFTFPEIPYASVTRLVVLPNFPDVCFIHFRRSTYKMYVVFRVRKADYLSKLARIISIWNEASFSDSERTEVSVAQSQTTQQIHKLKPAKNEDKVPHQLVIHNPHNRPLQSEEKVPNFLPKNHSKSQTRNKVRSIDALEIEEPCELICIKPNYKPLRPINQSQPSQKWLGGRHRKRHHSEPRFRPGPEVEIHEDNRPRFRARPGKSITVIPTQYASPPMGRNKRINAPQGRVIVAQKSESNSSESSLSNLSELLELGSVEVRTIYPSSIDLERLSPKSLRNERLLHAFRNPLNAHDSHGRN